MGEPPDLFVRDRVIELCGRPSDPLFELEQRVDHETLLQRGARLEPAAQLHVETRRVNPDDELEASVFRGPGCTKLFDTPSHRGHRRAGRRDLGNPLATRRIGCAGTAAAQIVYRNGMIGKRVEASW